MGNILTIIISSFCGTVIGVIVGEPLKALINGSYFEKKNMKKIGKAEKKIKDMFISREIKDASAKNIKEGLFTKDKIITIDIIVNILNQLEYEEVLYRIKCDGLDRYNTPYRCIIR